MSRSLTLVVTESPFCRGIDMGGLSSFKRTTASQEALGSWLFKQQGVVDFLTEHRWSSGTRIILIGDNDPLPDSQAPHLTFPVDDDIYDEYEQVCANA